MIWGTVDNLLRHREHVTSPTRRGVSWWRPRGTGPASSVAWRPPGRTGWTEAPGCPLRNRTSAPGFRWWGWWPTAGLYCHWFHPRRWRMPEKKIFIHSLSFLFYFGSYHMILLSLTSSTMGCRGILKSWKNEKALKCWQVRKMDMDVGCSATTFGYSLQSPWENLGMHEALRAEVFSCSYSQKRFREHKVQQQEMTEGPMLHWDQRQTEGTGIDLGRKQLRQKETEGHIKGSNPTSWQRHLKPAILLSVD